MPTSVIMPALELAQETGKVIRWLKSAGDPVTKGEPIVEIETDKVTTEIEAAASGILREVTAQEGDVVPVGQAIAIIVEMGDHARGAAAAPASPGPGAAPRPMAATGAPAGAAAIKASPLARKIAEQHGVDLALVKTASGKIEKADVPAHVESLKAAPAGNGPGLAAASPKARRLARERGVEVAALLGSGPRGAVLAADVPAATVPSPPPVQRARVRGPADDGEPVGTVWRIMAERMTASWTSAPHF